MVILYHSYNCYNINTEYPFPPCGLGGVRVALVPPPSRGVGGWGGEDEYEVYIRNQQYEV